MRRAARLALLTFALTGFSACGPGGVERLAAEFPAHKRELERIREGLLQALASAPAASVTIVGSEYGPKLELDDGKTSFAGKDARQEIERRGLTPVLESLDKLEFVSAGVDRVDGREVWVSTNGALGYLWRENGRPPEGRTKPLKPIRDEPGWFAAD